MRGCGHGKVDAGRQPSTGVSSWAAQSDIRQQALKIAGAFEGVGHAPHFAPALHDCSALAGGTGAGSPIWAGDRDGCFLLVMLAAGTEGRTTANEDTRYCSKQHHHHHVLPI